MQLIHDGEPTSLDIMVERAGNPRSTITLIDSMAEVGQQVAVRARRLPDGSVEYYEGSRRVATARSLGWTEIGVKFTDDLTDEEVDRLRLVYGNGAEPLTPLDEGAGYAALQAIYQHSVASIARTVRRSEEYVRQRLTLNGLPESCKTLLRDGKIGISGAIHLAQVTAPNAIHKLCERIERDYTTRGEKIADITVRSYAREYLLKLDGACFDIKDPDLGSVACAECPKRFGKQMTLLGLGDPGTDACTDFACWERKQDAHWERVRAQVPAVEGAVNAHGPVPGSGYVTAKAIGPDVVACRDAAGKTHLLIKQAKPEIRVNHAPTTAPKPEMPKVAPKPEMKPEQRTETLSRCFARIKEDPAAGMGMVVRAACATVFPEHLEEVCSERDLTGEAPPAERLAIAATQTDGLCILLDVLAAGSDDALKAADGWKSTKAEPPKAAKRKGNKPSR